MSTAAWENFYTSAFPRSWAEAKDGLDIEALHALDEAERARAEALLLEALDKGGSIRAIQGLGVLGSRAAAPRLTVLLERGDPATQVAACEALWRIERRPDVVPRIEAALARMHGAKAEFDRITVPHALATVGTREALDALARLLERADESSLLFWNTALSLAKLRDPSGWRSDIGMSAQSLGRGVREWLQAQGIVGR